MKWIQKNGLAIIEQKNGLAEMGEMEQKNGLAIMKQKNGLTKMGEMEQKNGLANMIELIELNEI